MDRIGSFLRRAWSSITIEPVVVLYLTSMGLNEVIRPNLLLDKACYQKLNFTAEICENLTNDTQSDNLDKVSMNTQSKTRF